jgi:hypothetical protein
MTARAHQRGHPIHFDDDQWRYTDNDSPASSERPCASCGAMPTPDGFDACLGYVQGVSSACCGHGVEEPFSQ